MKKKFLILLIAVLLILFFPIPQGTLNDGGTSVYSALTYKIVAWHKYIGTAEEEIIYSKTSVFWFPDNRKPLSELWQMECENNQ